MTQKMHRPGMGRIHRAYHPIELTTVCSESFQRQNIMCYLGEVSVASLKVWSFRIDQYFPFLTLLQVPLTPASRGVAEELGVRDTLFGF